MNPQQYPPLPGQNPQGYPPQPQPGAPYGMPGQPLPGGVYQPAPPAMQPQPYQQQPMPIYQAPPINPMAGYNPYANPYATDYDTPSGPRQRSKLPLVLIGGFAVILIIIVLAAMASGGGSSNNGATEGNTTTQTTDPSVKDVVDRSDGQLDLRSRVNASKDLKAQTVQARIKQQINLSSGFSFMANKINVYQSTNGIKPGDGKRFVAVLVVVGNRNESGNISISYQDFRLRGENNLAASGSSLTNEFTNNQLASPRELKPGEQTSGYIVFEVNATDTNLVLRHNESYQKTTDNSTFNVTGEIVLQPTAATTNPTTTGASTSQTGSASVQAAGTATSNSSAQTAGE